MSNIDPLDKYVNPPLVSKTDTIYKSYSQFSSLAGHPQGELQPVYVDQPNPNDYPGNANYARFPVMVNCDKCKNLGMTEIQYIHGFASKFWCAILLPILCTGSCCLCLNSCKDVEHKCNKCHATLGYNKSSTC